MLEPVIDAGGLTVPRTGGVDVVVASAAGNGRAGKSPLSGTRPGGSNTAYVRAGVEGFLPAEGGAVVVELAPAGRRFAAMVIDLLVAGMSLVVPALLASGLQSVIDPDSDAYFLLGVWLIGFVWLTFYGTVCVAWWGGTPGLLVSRLRVARVWEGNAKPTFAQAFRRARFLATVGWLIPLVNVFVVLVRLGNVLKERPYHHSSFDTIVGTVVIRHQSLLSAAAS